MSNKMVPPLVLLACLPAAICAAPAPERPKEEVLAKGQTVVLGTWTWKIEGNELGGKQGADFQWQRATETEANLVPQGGAGWAIIKEKAFDKVTREDLAKADYSTEKLAGTQLTPDTVVAVRTSDGKFAKLRVVGYRELHDVTFPEAKHLSPAWVQAALQRDNIKEYHLEVNWVLYKDPK
jgi:hypothetical protein